MSRDLLSEATRALREAENVSELEARATRARVMTGLHQTRVRRRTRLAFLLPIAATFVAASAWGAANGQARLIFERIEQLVGISAKPTSVSQSHSPRATSEGHPAPLTALAPLTESAREEPQVVTPPVPNSSLSAVSLASATPQAGARDAALALYRVAHQAHFVEQDPARALTAWNAYLAAAPNGQFAPEAKYNRALSLVRLGRDSEARLALEPFASGAFGSYRKAEASALLERLAQ